MLRRIATPRNLLILLVVSALFVLGRIFPVLRAPSPMVSLASEPIFRIGPFTVTNALFTTWIVMLVLIALAFLATRRIPRRLDDVANRDLTPSGLQNLLELVVESIHNMVRGMAGRWTPQFFPILMTIFLLVLASNWLGLLPGFGSIGLLEPSHDAGVGGAVVAGRILTTAPAMQGEGVVLAPLLRAPSTDLNFTLALGFLVVMLSQYFGYRALGPGYLKKYFDTSGFRKGLFMGIIGLFVGLLELITEIARILSFGFRLFGNVFAGEVLLAVMAFLIPYLISVPFYGLELFVGFIQAAVFLMLALVFFTIATVSHAAEADH